MKTVLDHSLLGVHIKINNSQVEETSYPKLQKSFLKDYYMIRKYLRDHNKM